MIDFMVLHWGRISSQSGIYLIGRGQVEGSILPDGQKCNALLKIDDEIYLIQKLSPKNSKGKELPCYQ